MWDPENAFRQTQTGSLPEQFVAGSFAQTAALLFWDGSQASVFIKIPWDPHVQVSLENTGQ